MHFISAACPKQSGKETDMTDKIRIPIFLASDDNYLPYLAVTVKSIDDLSSDEYIYDVRILGEGLNAHSLALINSMPLRNTTVSVVNVTEHIGVMRGGLKLRLRDYYSESIFYRLFIADMFPEFQRVIYIDCDVVLVSDIAELYFTDMGDSIIAAVPDECIPSVPAFVEYVDRWVGVTADKYINSGVLVMNLAEFREAGIFDSFAEAVEGENPDTVAPDQDYLNALCHGRIHYLGGEWNKQPNEQNPIPVSQLKLIHYNMFKKPWHYTDVLYGEEFWRVARTTPFADFISSELASYTDEERRADEEGAARLVEHAARLAESGGSLLRRVVNV